MDVCKIDELICILTQGGGLRTGVDITGSNGLTRIEKYENVDRVQTLLSLKMNGVDTIGFDRTAGADIWDKDGKSIFDQMTGSTRKAGDCKTHDLDLKRIMARLKESTHIYREKITNFESVFLEVSRQLKENDGKMDTEKVIGPMEDLVRFLIDYDPSYSVLIRNPLKSENYRYSHVINVCHIGAAVLKRFNDNFSSIINRHLAARFTEQTHDDSHYRSESFIYYIPEAVHEIVTGFLLHDVGKALIPDEIINKEASLSEAERTIIRTHSYEKGLEILDKNNIYSLYIRNIVKWHHAAIYAGEPNGYPEGILPIEIPPYVKICKIIDTYDAMTSKRAYGEASDPSSVVTQIFRRYERQDPMLQYILHAFIREMGICPMGSVIHLRNGQLAFVLERKGPVVLPLTDAHGDSLKRHADPFDISVKKCESQDFEIDRRKAPLPPMQALKILPADLKGLFLKISDLTH